MVTEPMVGVAVPTLNVGPYLAEAVRSLQAVRVPFRAVIRDGGSTDGSFESAREMVASDDRFTVTRQADAGQADAIARAWESLPANCDLLTWLNADDVLHPHGFAAAVAKARTDHRLAAVYGDFLLIDEDGLVVEMVRRPRRVSRVQLVYNECLVPGLVPILRREAVEAVGGLDASLHYGLDYDLFIRLAAWGPLVRTPHIVASFREHRGSKTLGERADDSVTESAAIRSRYQRLPRSAARAARTVLRSTVRARRMVGRWGVIERFGREPSYRQPRE